MLSVPVFKPWRPIWDAQLGSLTTRIDELASRRARGAMAPPDVGDHLLEFAMSERVESFLQSSLSKNESLAVLSELQPLIRAAVWPRWLLLEDALEEASS